MLIRMQEQLKENYQASASWLMTRLTRAYIRSLVLSSTNGLQYTWEPDFKRQSPTLLLGAPVYIAKEGDLAGRVSGNFVAGQVPLIYGDFSQGYEVTRHTEMYLIDDIYTGAAEFVRNLHIMARFGGNVIKSEALVQLTIS
jgi:HK97 family phage major capsid protein